MERMKPNLNFQGGSYSKYIKEAVHGIWNNTSVENKILNSAALQRKLAYSVKSWFLLCNDSLLFLSLTLSSEGPGNGLQHWSKFSFCSTVRGKLSP